MIHHSAAMPQGRAFSGIMTQADLNDCAAFRRKHRLDLDPVSFKPCTVDPGGDRARAPPGAPTVAPTAFLFCCLCFYTPLQLRCQIYPHYFTDGLCLCESRFSALDSHLRGCLGSIGIVFQRLTHKSVGFEFLCQYSCSWTANYRLLQLSLRLKGGLMIIYLIDE